ncbi:hypothetical protein CONPUDRAFT_136178 [Coniophora puteana RWD-64-598 SS2]|uniref:C4-dicarboxylate transporter malic acid transport protein n=1 Tax=Coniophora puteana (strain RWD-64-598) TaxID=741705 RepID=A0A5M3MWP9_CONPW|nr:uncharacterized protein CONPUDRAFT_136178 [Coniophora puteana RWD-64-598 SS2]EIW83021.1 hypothetical protein CONPUDRAFT_136178 [Coniophora puteana RWD-64-598 SS2]
MLADCRRESETQIIYTALQSDSPPNTFKQDSGAETLAHWYPIPTVAFPDPTYLMSSEGLRKKSFKDIVRHFTPAWFAVTMGTGAIAILFHSFPYGNDTPAMKAMTLVFFFLNLALFTLFTIISITRYILFPDVWSLMIRHPAQSLYLGTFPMGGATLIVVATGGVFETYGFGGSKFVYALWAFWWLDVAISFICCWGVMHVMKTHHDHTLKSMTTAWLLPVVTLIVASSTGGVLAGALQEYSHDHAFLTVVVSAWMVTVGLSLSLMMLTIYLLRLIVHGYPPGLGILSSFLPLGPSGQAGFSILTLGQAFKQLLPLKYGQSTLLKSPSTPDTIEVICVTIAFVLWAYASMWILFALLGLQDAIRHGRLPFKLSFWSTIFPNGVYANLTLSLAETFDSNFFRIWGAIYSVATLLLWVSVVVPTVSLVPSGVIFDAPCLEERQTKIGNTRDLIIAVEDHLV